MYQKLFNQLTTTDSVVTVNRRLAAFLKQGYAQNQIRAHQQAVWEAIAIYPFNIWLENLWQDCQLNLKSPPPYLLRSEQELVLWEKMIAESSEGKHLLRPGATAKAAYQAWQLVNQWFIDLNHPLLKQSLDSLTWLKWSQEFISLCKNKNWLSSQRLPEWLALQLSKGCNFLPKRLFLVGFEELNPQYMLFCRKLMDVGCEVIEYQPTPRNTEVFSLALPDCDAEIYAMARWAYQLNKQNIGNIGCVVPNLSSIRNKVNQIFSEIFLPESQIPSYQELPMPFNISAGSKLIDYSLIRTAFTLLKLEEKVNIHDLSVLLRSPYIAYAETEFNSRGKLDASLRAIGETYLLLDAVKVLAKKNNAPYFARHLQHFISLLVDINASRTANQWAIFFSRQLAAFGWPGERTINSFEHQLIESWSKLLKTFSQLTIVLPSLSHREALHFLLNLAQAQEFQPQSDPVSVQVLGLLEAAGLEFERLWVMGLDDNSWPSSANPNPFIPIFLQRKLNIPHSTSSRELTYCQKLTEKFSYSAQQVIFSYPQIIEDRFLQPSPLIKFANSISMSDLQLFEHQSFAELIQISARLELITDEVALPVSVDEQIKGGSGIFKSQSVCPFQAFARYRLGALPLEFPKLGLSAKERGSILHHALEITWNQLSSYDQLLKYSSDKLQTLIQEAIDTALLSITKKRTQTIKQRFIAIEKKRLTKIISEWLKYEKQRAPFSIYLTEKVQSFTLGNVPLELRVDRIDLLADGSYGIIDYKTGMPNISAWLGERPDEPQLPLYCVSSNLPISTVMFAQIRSNEKKFLGITSQLENVVPGVKTWSTMKNFNDLGNWESLINNWRETLSKIGEHFMKGEAKVDPKDGLKTCQFCDLKIFCRKSF